MTTSLLLNLARWTREAERLNPAARDLADFAAKTLAVSARDLAEHAARSRGSGFWSRLAEGVRCRAQGASVSVDHASNATNGLAEHVHKGGPIRPRNSKFLAIPLDKSLKGEWASERVWRTKTGKPLFIRLKPNAGGERALLAEERGKGRSRFLKALYVLVRRTRPQKPRPWWPEDKEFQALAERETAFWLEHRTKGLMQ